MQVTGQLLTELSVGAVALYTLVTAASRAIDRLLALAEYYDVPDVLVGMTVLALGTSLPELASHVIASLGILSGVLDFEVTSAVVLGGNTGSSTVQQFLLVGMLVIGYGTIQLRRTFVRGSYLPMLGALAVTAAVAWDGLVSRLDGLLLLGLYVVYVAYSVSRRERTQSMHERPSANPHRDGIVALVLLVLVLLSASLLLGVVELVVETLDLGGSMVGLVTLGVASALPELTTVVEAIRRRAPNVALGTLVGSNIANPLVGVGLGGLISTYHVPRAIVVWDLPFKILVGAAVLGYATLWTDRTLTRRLGGTLVGLYFVFLVGRLLLFPAQ